MEIHKYKCTNTVSIESSLKTRHPPPPPFPPAGSTLPRAVRSIPAFFLSYSGFAWARWSNAFLWHLWNSRLHSWFLLQPSRARKSLGNSESLIFSGMRSLVVILFCEIISEYLASQKSYTLGRASLLTINRIYSDLLGTRISCSKTSHIKLTKWLFFFLLKFPCL